MDSKEIEDFKEAVKNLTESLNTLNGATEQSEQNFKDVFGKKFPNAGLASIKGLEGLGDAASSAAAAIYRGERGMKVMANAFGGLADTIQAIAGIVTFLTPWGRALKLSQQLLINGGAALAKGFSSFQKLTAEQSDKLFDVYQNLSKVGAVGAGGMEALNESLMRAGFTIAEIDKFAGVINKNAKDLTYFGASAQDGAKNLVDISGAILKSDLGYSLQMLGYNAADLADATATNIVLQTRLGRVQNKTVSELAVEGAKFALELDKMARFTGISREEQEQARKSLIEDERYAGFLAGEARQMGYNIQAFESVLSTITDPETRKGLQHLIAGRGTATTPEARKVVQTDPYAYERMLGVLQNRTSAMDAARSFGTALGEYSQRFAPLTQFTGTGPGVNIGGQAGALMYSERIKAIEAAAKAKGMKPEDFIQNEQEMARLNQGALKDQVVLRRKQLDIGQTLDTTINQFSDLNKVTASLVTQFDNLLSKGPTPAGGRPTTGPAPTVGGGWWNFKGMFGGGTTGKETTPGGGIETPTPATGAVGKVPETKVKPPATGAVGKVPETKVKPPATGISGVIEKLFGRGQALSGKPLTGLDQDFADRFSSAADEYFKATGKKVNVTSALRTYEEQQREYERYLTQGGLPAAQPGTSRHEIGRAVDVDRATAEAMDAMGILQKYGLSRPVPNDPVHIQGAFGFRGRVSGPLTGYRPNVLMHGDEEISIRPMNVGTTNTSAGVSEGTVQTLISKVEDLVGVAQKQLYVNEKILKYQH